MAAQLHSHLRRRTVGLLRRQVAATTMSRFWAMLATTMARSFNASEFGRAFGVTDRTVRHYLDVLSSTLVVRQLLPFHANTASGRSRP